MKGNALSRKGRNNDFTVDFETLDIRHRHITFNGFRYSRDNEREVKKMFINEERVLDRIEELEEFINNFPESALTPIFKSEIEYLELLLKGVR